MNMHRLTNSAVPLHRQDIETMLEVVIAMQRATGEMAIILTASLDRVDGDPDQENATDLEDDFALSPLVQGFDKGRGPGCEISDTGDTAYIEWTQMAPTMRGVRNHCGSSNEDDEEDGEDCGHDEGEPDMRSYRGQGAGCRISDDDKAVDDDGCDDNWDDQEIEQMSQDVPMLATYSLDYSLFTDKRDFLGIGNLTASYRTNGGEVLSADSGAVLVSKATDDPRKLGGPV